MVVSENMITCTEYETNEGLGGGGGGGEWFIFSLTTICFIQLFDHILVSP